MRLQPNNSNKMPKMLINLKELGKTLGLCSRRFVYWISECRIVRIWREEFVLEGANWHLRMSIGWCEHLQVAFIAIISFKFRKIFIFLPKIPLSWSFFFFFWKKKFKIFLLNFNTEKFSSSWWKLIFFVFSMEINMLHFRHKLSFQT